jgi:hypothetical protein
MSGMHQALLMQSSAETDPSFASVSALLHFDGSDGSTTFTDVTGTTWTANGNAQIDTAQSVFGGASGLFDGTGDFITTPDATKFSLSNADFCIEARVRLNTNGRLQTLTNKRDGSSAEEFSIYINADNTVGGQLYNSGAAFGVCTSTATLSTGVWYAIAYTRSGSNFALYINGTRDGTATSASSASNNTSVLRIGRDGFNTGRDLDGWVDEYRFTKGAARYTGASYTVRTTPFPDS